MRKTAILLSLLSMIVLFGCSLSNHSSNSTPNEEYTVTIEMNANDSLIFSTYLASGLLTSDTSNNLMNMSINNNFKFARLTDETTTSNGDTLEIETELDEVNKYFDKLKVFMDQGVDSVLNVNEQASTNASYDFEITYTIEDVTYTIYYSLIEDTEVVDDTVTTMNNDIDTTDDEVIEEEEEKENDEVDEEKDEDEDDDEGEVKEDKEFQLVGMMVINGVNYDLQGANEIEGNEQKMWFETIDSSNGENYVRVEIKKENGEQKFEIETIIDGVETESEIKFEEENNETKVELKLVQNGVESSYEFKKEVEGDKTTYKFEYQIGEVKGEVKVVEFVDSTGNVTYKYDIEENGKRKEIEKEDHDDHDDDEDETDDNGEGTDSL